MTQPQQELEQFFSYDGSVVVPRESLVRTTEFLQETFPKHALTARVFREKTGEYVVQSLHSLPSVGNPKGTPIYAVRIDADGPESSLSFVIMDTSPTVRVTGQGLSPSELSALRMFAANECHNIRTFYWWWSYGVARVGRLLPLRVWLVLWLALVARSLYSYFAGSPSTRVGSESPAGPPPSLPTGSPVPTEVSGNVLTSILGLLLFCGVVFGAVRLLHGLFPRAYFKVGEGLDRYTHIVWGRRLLFGTLVVSPVAGYFFG